jgi:hypothetical protein
MLAMWTVYKHPTDYPDKYVARRFEVDASGPRATASVIIMDDLTALRETLCFEMYLTRFTPRSENDDPKIVETWI